MRDIPEILGVLTGFCLVVVVPLVWILLAHQRKIAELVHGRQAVSHGLEDRMMRIESRLEELRQLMYDQALQLDDQRHVLEGRKPPRAT